MVIFLITALFGFYMQLSDRHCKTSFLSSNLFLELALALDNAGNVLMQHVLNDTLLVKRDETYYFGNKLETISNVIGNNSLTHTLSTAGKWLNRF